MGHHSSPPPPPRERPPLKMSIPWNKSFERWSMSSPESCTCMHIKMSSNGRWIWLNYLKCHFQGRKGQVWPIFPSISILLSSNEVLPHIYCIMCETKTYPKIWKLWNHFQGQKYMDLCDFSETVLISQKRCMIWPMSLWNTYTKSYIIFQFTLRPLTLDYI